MPHSVTRVIYKLSNCFQLKDKINILKPERLLDDCLFAEWPRAQNHFKVQHGIHFVDHLSAFMKAYVA